MNLKLPTRETPAIFNLAGAFEYQEDPGDKVEETHAKINTAV